MDDPDFDDVGDPTSQAGITCSVCHSITHINSPRGNADYTIAAPLHYPFAASGHPWLRWLNQTLVKAKPAFHKKSFLKPLHRSTEFCGSCHKVHLSEELNAYRWLRGQNHYDTFWLSGVSGHGVRSFYYPERAEPNCNGCHMSLVPSDDFGARRYDAGGELSVHEHQFPAANTAIPHMLGLPEWVNQRHREALRDVMRVDIFGVREAGRIDGALSAPLDSSGVRLEPGKQYLIEVVIRSLGVGHDFTQGTADSNQVWLSLTATSNGEVLGHNGALLDAERGVDPWAHFVNAYVIDRGGLRIDRRNPEDIFTQLYNHQIPPGAAAVVHYRLSIPEQHETSVELSAALNYRKFDNAYLRQIEGQSFAGNSLPITVLAEDRIRLAVGDPPAPQGGKPVPEWQRWNDYGIGLLRNGQLRQAEDAFARVESLGRRDGALNLARVYLREGRLAEAADALLRASETPVPAYPWSLSYFTAQLNLQNGFFDEAIAAYRDLVETRFAEARRRGFDFSRDYRLLNDLATALAERAKLERRPGAVNGAREFRQQAVSWFERALELDPENTTAHYDLAQLHEQLGDASSAARHRVLHARYKVDDNARDRAVQLARRRDAAADRAANDVVIYPLRSPQSAPMSHDSE